MAASYVRATCNLLCRSSQRVVRHTAVSQQQQRFFATTYDDKLEGTERKWVTLIPGDGVGPELCGAVKHVFNSVGVPVDFEEVDRLFLFIFYFSTLFSRSTRDPLVV